ncbi:hypothetical protein [Vibrio sp. V04_P4A5T148]|uniref:hypothetical protein n=1 Tax=Vibrio sp. V04_P4A5T148 TaxID=1938659 RepID=UPI000B8ECB2E|nr:hypothetical protein [Vibrio sp. V04_P4A5T148]OXX31011.1 hypothetical protein B9J81_15000 [Vibrio sp. V04_P4A5T148]
MSTEKLVLSSEGQEFLLSISPDWPMIIITGLIGIGSIFTSIVVGRITKQNQLSQNLAKKAQLRQAWITELREHISQFISLASTIKLRRSQDDDFYSSEKFYEYHSQLIASRTRIHLMLDANKEYTKILKSLIKDYYQETVTKDGVAKDVGSYRKALEEQTQIVLEKAWLDIKSELT